MGDGAQLKDWILAIAGNIFIVILVVRAVGYYAKKEWGELVTHVLMAVIIAGFVYFTDGTIVVLKQIWNLLSGA
jgi:hypothetical protein